MKRYNIITQLGGISLFLGFLLFFVSEIFRGTFLGFILLMISLLCVLSFVPILAIGISFRLVEDPVYQNKEKVFSGIITFIITDVVFIILLIIVVFLPITSLIIYILTLIIMIGFTLTTSITLVFWLYKYKKMKKPLSDKSEVTPKKGNWKHYLLILTFIGMMIFSILDIFNIIPDLFTFNLLSAEQTIVLGIIFYSSVILVTFLIFRKRLNKKN